MMTNLCRLESSKTAVAYTTLHHISLLLFCTNTPQDRQDEYLRPRHKLKYGFILLPSFLYLSAILEVIARHFSSEISKWDKNKKVRKYFEKERFLRHNKK